MNILKLAAGALGGKWLWIIGGVVLASVLGTASLWAFNKGKDSGYSSAYEDYRTELTEIRQNYRDQISKRDSQWESYIDDLEEDYRNAIAQQQKDIERERELRENLEVTVGNLRNVVAEYEGADLGTCSLSPDADRMFEHFSETLGGRSATDPAAGEGDSGEEPSESDQ